MRAMELRDRICVVTGGASGIGRALCQRFAAEGARAVVVVDRLADGAVDTAGSIGDVATPMAADVTVEADIEAVVERTEEEIGPIDLFVSNAGILGLGGIDLPDETWDMVWRVNVMAHLFAARARGAPHARAGRRLPAVDGLGGRAADPAGRRPLLGDQARARSRSPSGCR